MKKNLFLFVSVVTVVTALAMAAFMFVPHPRVGWDFDLRYNEILCLKEGVDPYDVWSGKVEHAPYYSYSNPSQASDRLTRCVNAYPPWAYTFGWPLTWLPESTAWYLFFAFHFLVLAALGVFGFRYASRELVRAEDARLASAAAMLLIMLAAGSCFQSGNYPIVVLAATVAMVWCLDRGHDVFAGFCWALAMIKPQMALLFAVPLLFRRKFVTCAVAATTCLLASVPPMLLCHKGLVELISNGAMGSTCAFMGCGTFPGFLIPLCGQSASIVIALAIGLMVCIRLTRMTPRKADWFVLVTPAVFIGSVWTYAQLYASVVNWMPLLLIVMAVLRRPSSLACWIFAALAALFMTRAYTFYHGITMLLPAQLGYSFELHGILDSLNSLVCLVVFAAFWRHEVKR